VSAFATDGKMDGVASEWLPSVTTALVAVAGIAGTLRGASVSRRAQIEVARLNQVQALLVEKRTVYADFLQATDELISVLKRRDRLRESLRTLREEVDAEPSASRLPVVTERLDLLGSERTDLSNRYDSLEHRVTSLAQRITVIGGPMMAVLAGSASVDALGGARGDSFQILTLAMYLDTDPDRELNDQSLKELAEMRTESLPFIHKIIGA
jgi:hypothetical protein